MNPLNLVQRWHRGSRVQQLIGLGLWGSLVGMIGMSASVGLSAVALPNRVALPDRLAQTDPNTGFTGTQIPSTSVTPTNGRVNLRFINETGSAIEYQVIGDTEYRTLAGRSEMTLERLRVPTTFTFRRADNGFLKVTLLPDSATGTVTLQVRETPNFAEDRTSVYVDQRGNVYLN
ncbi:MAG: hypothetical protein HC827_00900 [Cyanobacteria bacterium RM1_2_2]|nr:hypothetical protein [Cyanobacteria bacterium RM1_2_2]